MRLNLSQIAGFLLWQQVPRSGARNQANAGASAVKFELKDNLKRQKALGPGTPEAILATADEAID